MRVLHIVDTLALGGAQIILKSLLESERNNRNLHAFALRSIPKQMVIHHPNVRVHPSARRFSFAPLRDLRHYVTAHRIDVLHCHLFRSQFFGFVLKTLFFPDAVLVFHEHGRVVGRENEAALEALAFKSFLRLAGSLVDRFICISAHTRVALEQCVLSAHERTVVIHNPLPAITEDVTALSRQEAKHRLGVPHGAFTVGFAGRLVRRKGWMDFLDAIHMIGKRHDIYFLLAGDGPDRRLVDQHMNKLRLGERGRLLGQVLAMGAFYRALDCLVMPSHWEPHGLVQLEAQRAGVPVIASNVPGLRETVCDGTNALLFETGNPKSLASRIDTLARNVDLRDLLVRGGFANAERYSIEVFARAVVGVYASASADRPAKRPSDRSTSQS